MKEINTIPVRIPKKLYAEARELARDTGITLTQALTMALQQGLDLDKRGADHLLPCPFCKKTDLAIFVYGKWAVGFCEKCRAQLIAHDVTKLPGISNVRGVEKGTTTAHVEGKRIEKGTKEEEIPIQFDKGPQGRRLKS